MNIQDLQEKLKIIKEKITNLSYQINAIEILETHLILENSNGEEQVVRFDASSVIKEYMYKESELIFFIIKYVDELINALYNINQIFSNSNSCLNGSYPNCFNFSFYFDSMITQTFLIIESEQRVQLEHYFGKNNIEKFYPNRNVYGLWWEIFMLRNRIVHFTENRFLNNDNECKCYYSFSSKCNRIYINNDNVSIPCTLIDIYKHNNLKLAIEKAILSKSNPFDLLFPNKSAKGRNKKSPIITYIATDIYFDYASSGIRLLDDIYIFLNSTNNVFFKYYCDKLKNKDTLMEIKLQLDNNGKICIIKDLFDLK